MGLNAMYPTEVPIAEVTTLVEIVRGGALLERRQEAQLCGWWIGGYVLGKLDGGPKLIGESCEELDDEGACVCMEEMLAEGEGEENAKGLLPQIAFTLLWWWIKRRLINE